MPFLGSCPSTLGGPPRKEHGDCGSAADNKRPKQLQFWGFRGGRGPGYMSLAALPWVPMCVGVHFHSSLAIRIPWILC